jgi:hypothetical protein
MDSNEVSILIKPPETSHWTSEENEDFENRLSQLKNQINEMNGSMWKHVNLSYSKESLKNKMEKNMEDKMNENWEDMEKKMDDMKKKIDKKRKR